MVASFLLAIVVPVVQPQTLPALQPVGMPATVTIHAGSKVVLPTIP